MKAETLIKNLSEDVRQLIRDKNSLIEALAQKTEQCERLEQENSRLQVQLDDAEREREDRERE